MEFEAVRAVVEGIPHMRPPQGKRLYDHILQTEARQVLELGCAHGVSACYLAAAVDELGGDGRVVTMDRRAASRLKPNVHDLAERAGLSHLIEPIFAERSFTWELKRLLELPDPPTWDLVFLDGGHTWDVTGFAFFLVDLMVRPGGWLVFDDLEWSVASSPSMRDTEWAKSLPEEERNDKQVSSVFKLLVESHPRYEAHRSGKWGWARKLA